MRDEEQAACRLSVFADRHRLCIPYHTMACAVRQLFEGIPEIDIRYLVHVGWCIEKRLNFRFDHIALKLKAEDHGVLHRINFFLDYYFYTF